MDWQRSLLFAAMFAVVYLLFLEWNEFKAQQPAVDQAPSSETITTGSVPALPAEVTDDSEGIPSPVAAPVKDAQVAMPEASNQLIQVKTDVLEVLIDPLGGDIVKVGLLKHRVTQEPGAAPIVLLNRTQSSTYIAQSGLIGTNGTDSNKGRPLFSSPADSYTMTEGEDQLTVSLFYQQGEVRIEKRFVFTRNDYLINLQYQVDNQSSSAWTAGLFGQIKRDSKEVDSTSGALAAQPFLGAALTTREENYKKLDFDDIAKKSFEETIKGGWVAMVQHYFASAWVPDQSQENHYTIRKLGNRDLYAMGFTSPQQTIAPGTQGEFTAAYYVGPKDQYRMEEIAPYLDLTLDYGWLWWVAKPLFWLLEKFHSMVGNWGWAIILLTILIKLLFFKLSATSYRSMANMRKLQPEMLRLKELYGDDRQKMSQATMELYKKEKVNPMGGCLPILVQMPVFIALYWVLSESVELRHAPWILWIKDLSVKDPYFILPLTMGISMFLQQKLNPAPPDPMQARIMQIMPVMFTFFFMFFPAGLVLYWTVNNILSIAQQAVITRKIEAAGASTSS